MALHKVTQEQLDAYVALVQKLSDANAAEYHWLNKPVISAEIGQRYVRIVKQDSQRSVHSFIDLENGNIMKASGWKAVAKNGVRGSIFSPDGGESVINWGGTKYLRG